LRQHLRPPPDAGLISFSPIGAAVVYWALTRFQLLPPLERRINGAAGKAPRANLPTCQPTEPRATAHCKEGAAPLVTSSCSCQLCFIHLTPYFYNWPVRMWPICRPEGDVGAYSARCRGEWSYNIPWPLCSLWWGDNWPGGAPGTDPPKIGVLECARSRDDVGIRYVSITY
jgi:hypothetical protein